MMCTARMRIGVDLTLTTVKELDVESLGGTTQASAL
jgi:hypothetical protein